MQNGEYACLPRPRSIHGAGPGPVSKQFSAVPSSRCNADDEAYPKIDFRIRSEASISPPGKKRTTKMKMAPKMMR